MYHLKKPPGICVDFMWGLLAGLFLLFVLRPYWGIMYTDEPDVQAMIYQTLPIMLLYVTVDSTKCIVLNILRSTGRPGITVRGNIVACVFVMLPLGYVLSLRMQLGLVGLWLAMSIAWLLATFVYLYIVLTTDWQKQADCAKDRNEEASSSVVRQENKNVMEVLHGCFEADEDEDEDGDETLVFAVSPLQIDLVSKETRWTRESNSKSSNDREHGICKAEMNGSEIELSATIP